MLGAAALYTKDMGKVEFKLKDMVNNHYPLSQSRYWSHTTNKVVLITREYGKNGTPNGETFGFERVPLLCGRCRAARPENICRQRQMVASATEFVFV